MSDSVPIIPYDCAAAQRVSGGLLRLYPFLRARAYGRSVCGRDLRAYTLGNGRDCVLFAAAFHGQEWMTSYIALRLLARLCEMTAAGERWRGEAVRDILQNRRVMIIPAVNPDGAEIALHGPEAACEFARSVEKIIEFSAAFGCGHVTLDSIGASARSADGGFPAYNANARGVDINHNFDAGWQILRSMERAAGITGPAPRRYGGPCPNSEPETRALCRLTLRENPSRAFALHSQGEEIFWEYGGTHIPGAKELALALAAESGYSLVENGGLASHGGYKDWFVKAFRRPGFTLEFGKGENPLPPDCFGGVWQKAEAMLLLAALGG